MECDKSNLLWSCSELGMLLRMLAAVAGQKRVGSGVTNIIVVHFFRGCRLTESGMRAFENVSSDRSHSLNAFAFMCLFHWTPPASSKV